MNHYLKVLLFLLVSFALYPVCSLADTLSPSEDVQETSDATRIDSDGFYWDQVDLYMLLSLVSVLVCVIIGFMIYRWRRNKTYIFPLFTTPTRLGGDHAAGVGAVIVFKNRQLSPSDQHSKEPRYTFGV